VSARRARGIGAGCAVVCACGVSALACFSPAELPPPAAPAQEVPAAAANLGPAAPGRQWVVLDTPGDTAKVSTVVGSVNGTTAKGYEVTGEATRDLCITPCVADLRVGMHTLVFASTTDPTRSDRVDVQAQTNPLVVRDVMPQGGPTPTYTAGVLTGGIGFALAVAGAVMAPVGAHMKSVESADHLGTPSSGLEDAGFAMLGVGGAMMVLGVVLGYVGRGEHRAGATTVFTIPSAAAPAGAPTAGAQASPGLPEAPALLRF
jgi:hypothetical protein